MDNGFDEEIDWRIDLIKLGHWQNSQISFMSRIQLEERIQNREAMGWELIGKQSVETRGFGNVTWYSADMIQFVPLKSDPSFAPFWIRVFRIISAIFFVFWIVVIPFNESFNEVIFFVATFIFIPFLLQQFVDKMSVKKYRKNQLKNQGLEESFNERIN